MNNTTTFWNFLKNNQIEIPIIQRDYAQGRLGKENLRKNFLGDLKKALDNEKPFKDCEMKLDFVYGSTENGMFNPLDGQQRLTTLWLLHWYIALRAGVLNKNNCAILSKFTYKTRISSREFCESLCKPQNFKCFNGDNIVGFITKQTWFYSAWKQDPTIQSMLRMLGGTKIADKNGEDIVDGIEELFRETKKEDYEQYWQELTEKEKIVFFNLLLDDFGLSDDLYIKMNARGKQLTAFENFKADLIGYIRKQAEEATGDTKSDWSKLLDSKSGIPKLMDTTWTDIFWKYKSKDNNRIDEIYFAFLNRFFLNELVCQKNKDEFFYTAKQLEDNSVFSYLYGNESNDTSIEYVGFEKYKDIPLTFLNNLINTLKNIPSDIKLSDYHPGWVGQEFQYIPIYDEGSISSLKQRDRIAFHAISKYIQMGGFDDVSFRQWMRVVWNIVENAGVNSISSMAGVMRLIDELSNHSHNIYCYLADPNTVIKSNAAQEQVLEEIVKAKQIVNENGELRNYDGCLIKEDGFSYKTWEEIIIVAENTAFFKGAIRFLYTNGEGNEDWCDFETKWENAKKFFDEKGLTPISSEKSKLLRTFISYFDLWDCFKEIYYDNKLGHWKTALVNKKLAKPIHELLDKGTFCDFERYSSSLIGKDKKLQEQLVKTELVVKLSRSDYYMEDGRNLHVYHTYRKGNDIYLGYNRKLLLDATIQCENRIVCDDIFCGDNIDFKYRDFFFRWSVFQEKEYVYLMEDGWKECKQSLPTSDNGTDEVKYYCFGVSDEMDITEFTTALDSLIEESRWLNT